MDHFNYRHQRLYAEDVALETIANTVGTPCYVYSRATLERHWRVVDDAFGDYPHRICYSVKANSNLAVLRTLAKLGSGFDIVSGGELERVLRAGGDPQQTVFSGVGKTESEIRFALESGVSCINIESKGELDRIGRCAAELGITARIAVRVNPDVDPVTHPYIATGLQETKFGVPIAGAVELYQRASQHPQIEISGVACHIGSQLTDVGPYTEAVDRVLALVDQLQDAGILLQHVDLGGGLGIRYRDEQPPSPAAYVEALLARFKQRDTHIPISIEPGRVIVGNAGILLTRVEYLKHGKPKNFAIVDAAMNDLLRPALYQAWQEIVAVEIEPDAPTRTYDVVGPVCETADSLGSNRELAIRAGALLAIRSAGAYGAVMSSNYNTRLRAPEVLVNGERYSVVRRRETIDDVLRNESLEGV